MLVLFLFNIPFEQLLISSKLISDLSDDFLEDESENDFARDFLGGTKYLAKLNN